MNKGCVDCRYWVSTNRSGTEGDCHRFPQTIHKEYNDWCGEFRKNNDLLNIDPDIVPGFVIITNTDINNQIHHKESK